MTWVLRGAIRVWEGDAFPEPDIADAYIPSDERHDACGTYSGYMRHFTSKEPICADCRLARRIYRRDYAARKRTA